MAKPDGETISVDLEEPVDVIFIIISPVFF